MTTDRHHRLQVIFAFALVYVFWGSTYLAIGIADQERLPPAVMCCLRFAIAGPLMLAACAALGRKIRITVQEGIRLATIGCLLLVGGNCGLAWAEQWVPTGFAALIVAVTPIWFLLLETFVFRGDRLSRRGIVGVALGLAGVAVLFWPRFSERTTLGIMPLLGACTLLLSSLSWSIGSVASRKWQMKVDPFTCHRVGDGLRRHGQRPGGPGHRRAPSHRPHPPRPAGRAVSRGVRIVGGIHRLHLAAEACPHRQGGDLRVRKSPGRGVSGMAGLHERLDGYMFAGTAIIVGGVALVTTAKVHDGGKELAKRAMSELGSY